MICLVHLHCIIGNLYRAVVGMFYFICDCVGNSAVVTRNHVENQVKVELG